MAEPTSPIRRGIAKNLTLEREAVEVLRALTPSHKTQGWFVSTLLAAEQARREERARMKAAILQVFDAEEGARSCKSHQRELAAFAASWGKLDTFLFRKAHA